MKSLAKSNNCNIEQHIALNRSEFYNEDEDVRSDNYTVAYGLLFYLLKGCITMKKPEYFEIPFKYYNYIIENNTSKGATTAAWEGVDMFQFQKDFQKCWSNKSFVSKASRLDFKRIIDKRNEIAKL